MDGLTRRGHVVEDGGAPITVINATPASEDVSLISAPDSMDENDTFIQGSGDSDTN